MIVEQELHLGIGVICHVNGYFPRGGVQEVIVECIIVVGAVNSSRTQWASGMSHIIILV